MTDRELLEKAAKAIGWSCWQSKYGYLNVTDHNGASHVCCEDWPPFDSQTGQKKPSPTLADAIEECSWNPLIDDGDALRLAVKLNITDLCLVVGQLILAEGFQQDKYAATRRAIVRAAAEMAEKPTPKNLDLASKLPPSRLE